MKQQNKQSDTSIQRNLGLDVLRCTYEPDIDWTKVSCIEGQKEMESKCETARSKRIASAVIYWGLEWICPPKDVPIKKNQQGAAIQNISIHWPITAS